LSPLQKPNEEKQQQFVSASEKLLSLSLLDENKIALLAALTLEQEKKLEQFLHQHQQERVEEEKEKEEKKAVTEQQQQHQQQQQQQQQQQYETELRLEQLEQKLADALEMQQRAKLNEARMLARFKAKLVEQTHKANEKEKLLTERIYQAGDRELALVTEVQNLAKELGDTRVNARIAEAEKRKLEQRVFDLEERIKIFCLTGNFASPPP